MRLGVALLVHGLFTGCAALVPVRPRAVVQDRPPCRVRVLHLPPSQRFHEVGHVSLFQYVVTDDMEERVRRERCDADAVVIQQQARGLWDGTFIDYDAQAP